MLKNHQVVDAKNYLLLLSGIMKTMNSCKAAGLPTPVIEEDGGGLIVRLFKERFVEEELQKMGLNERQIKAVLYVKEKGKITNGEYQEINKISNRTASREILELVKANIIEQSGTFGAGSFYQLITPK